MFNGRVWLALAIVGGGIYAFKRFAPDSTQIATTSIGPGGGAMTIPESIDNEQPEISPNEPRGIRNNNPLNIRHNPANDWNGMTGVDDAGFVIFDDAASGYRAAGKILESYDRRGVNTVETIISEWAPSNENNTDAYISYVTSSGNLAAESMVSGASGRAYILRFMAGFENGSEYLPSFPEVNSAVA